MEKVSRFSLVVCVIFLFTGYTFASLPSNYNQKSSATTADAFPNVSVLDVNNFTTWVHSNGFFDWNSDGFTGLNGTFPKGQPVGVVFAQGFFWGGKVYDRDSLMPVRVNGSDYSNGLHPGAILYNSPGNPSSGVYGPDTTNQQANYHVWRVRRDWSEIDLTSSASQVFGVPENEVTADMIQTIHDQYENDWNTWPAELGAPYQDVDHNNVYNAAIDTPGVPGATQTLWLIANDLYPGVSQNTYGSPPVGIELQMTLWGYHVDGDSPFNNMHFRKYQFIYTGRPSGDATAHIDSMYFGVWADPDVGNSDDDFVGTDTSRSVIYAYNGTISDADYSQFNLNPPAVGWNLLQGPITAEHDTVSMASSVYFGSGSIDDDPDLVEYNGTLQWYNILRGFKPRPEYPESDPYINPLTGMATPFLLTGNPLNGTGWIDGMDLPPGDRRVVMGIGPFSMALGDTQNVIIAQNVALGHSNLSSVYDLWQTVDYSKAVYKNGFLLPAIEDTIASTPDIAIQQSRIIQENLTPDRIINNGEKAKFRLLLFNDGETLHNINISALTPQLTSNSNNYLESFPAGNTTSLVVEIQLPDNYSSDSTQIGIILEPNAMRSDTFYTSVPTKIQNWDVSLHEADHIEGNAGGQFYYRIADATQLKHHNYEIRIEGDSTFTFKDVTDDRIVLSDHKLPTMNGYEVPMVDGLRLYSTGDNPGLIWDSTEPRWITGVNWGGAVFFGGADVGQNFFGSTLSINEVEPVVLYFQGDSLSGPADGWASKGAEYLRPAYSYEGSGYLPFAAFAVDAAGNERQVNVTFLEDASAGSFNHRWDLGGWDGSAYKDSLTGGREYVFINKTDYDEGATYNGTNDGTVQDVMYAFWATQRGNHPYLEGAFTMSFTYTDVFDSSDVYGILMETKTTDALQLPTTFNLTQNYPNPFNPTTTIDYALPMSGEVTITIYNLLGREIVRLVDKTQQAGRYSTEWKSVNSAGRSVASGVYFYRLTVKDKSKTLYTKTNKMILLR